MTEKEAIEKIRSQIMEGIGLEKCRKCGCMNEALKSMQNSLSSLKSKESLDLLKNIESWLNQMEPIEYACLGCKYCYPAQAMNIFAEAFPETSNAQLLSCEFEIRKSMWPPVVGEYFAFRDGENCSVAVSTLASVELAEKLAKIKPKELCIVGKTETENIGIDKVIKNVITNPAIHFLILAGKDPKGHHSGKTLLALWENGVNENMRVIGSPGKRPILMNVTRQEVEAFRKQVQVVNMIGCEDVESIVKKLGELSYEQKSSCSCAKCDAKTKFASLSNVPVVRAEEAEESEMDKAGYFVIIPQQEKEIIFVEHYSYDNKLLRIIEGKDAKSICWTIIQNGWVTQLSHAAYLGKELMRAEISIKTGVKYVQDRA